MSYEAPAFTLHTDPEQPEVQWVTVDRWPRESLIDPSLIASAAHGASIRLDGTVSIIVRNGHATYQVVGWDPDARALKLELVSWLGPT